MLQINALLLATFAKNIRFGPDVASSLRRYQTLATLYLYLACFTKILCFELVIWILFPEPCTPQVIYIAAAFSLVGLLFLREGKKELAVISLLSYLHIGSYKVSICFRTTHWSSLLPVPNSPSRIFYHVFISRPLNQYFSLLLPSLQPHL